ncbi:MAG TPA: hypothetical protein VH374_22210 [Polyangia bacterium]|nr:hypothetical protein [Polyangia bacterium]
MRLQPQTGVLSFDARSTRYIKPPIRKCLAVGAFDKRVAQFVENQLRKRVVDIEDLWNPDEYTALPVTGGVTLRTTLYFETERARRTGPDLIDGGAGQRTGTIA